QGPVANKFFCGRLWVVPVAEEHHWIRASHRHLTHLTHRHRLTSRIDHTYSVAGDGASHRAWLDWQQHRTITEHQVHFGLAVAFVGSDAEFVACPADPFFAHRLAAGKNRPQAHVIVAPRGLDVTHHLECRRHEEGVAYPVPRHQVEGLCRIELAHTVRH